MVPAAAPGGVSEAASTLVWQASPAELAGLDDDDEEPLDVEDPDDDEVEVGWEEVVEAAFFPPPEQATQSAVVAATKAILFSTPPISHRFPSVGWIGPGVAP